MNITIEILSADQAREFEAFIMPNVCADASFDEYTFYAAIADDAVAGILVCDPEVFEPSILSVGVSPAYQGKGVATALLSYAMADILSDYDPDDEEPANRIFAMMSGGKELLAPIRRVFEKCGFSVASEGSFHEVNVADISGSPLFKDAERLKKTLASPDMQAQFTSLKDAPHRMLSAFGNALARTGEFPGITTENLDEDVSFFANDGERIYSCILFGKEIGGKLVNMFLYQDRKETADRRKLGYLLAASALAAKKKFPPETRLSFFIDNAATDKILHDIFPDAKPAEQSVQYEYIFQTPEERSAARLGEAPDLRPITNEGNVCGKCAFCTKSVLSCDKYSQKPDGVLEGGSCSLYEEA